MNAESLALINELVPGASPVGAYCMGMATAEIVNRGLEPDRQILEKMREMVTVERGEEVLELWLRGKES